jgi:hypothetical protein
MTDKRLTTVDLDGSDDLAISGPSGVLNELAAALGWLETSR